MMIGHWLYCYHTNFISFTEIASLVANLATIIGILGLWLAYQDYKNKQKEQASDLEEKEKIQKQKETERKEKLKIATSMLWSEIEYNRKKLKLMVTELPKPNIPYPGLEVSAWETIDKSIIVDGLKVEDVSNILGIYNRFNTINMQYYTLLDKVNWIEDINPKPTVKGEFMDSLIIRCKEALNFIEGVIPENFKEKQKHASKE